MRSYVHRGGINCSSWTVRRHRTLLGFASEGTLGSLGTGLLILTSPRQVSNPGNTFLLFLSVCHFVVNCLQHSKHKRIPVVILHLYLCIAQLGFQKVNYLCRTSYTRGCCSR